MQLTLGPVLYHWPAEQLIDFYARIADEAPVDRVVIGEAVCSKRRPFYEVHLPSIAERLARGGKEVVYASLALITLRHERRAERELARSGLSLEINDLTLLGLIGPQASFSVGPLVNTYNEGTLAFLAGQGAAHVCLPPELPLSSVEVLARAGEQHGVPIEVWAFGRVPLAISARCYHARLAGRTKDSCQFACADDPDGLSVDTLEGEPFLTVNGVQTLSERYTNLVCDLPMLRQAGVTSLRLSPHSGDMVAVARLFRDVADEAIDPDDGLAQLWAQAPERRFCNGFLFGDAGADWTH
ncbi:MAG: U32 family peptidase [Rhodospirillales bacterium CG15_BIG_FIL_POST_REV_8_21_14_020_66_15]|nr:MAG: U32 family peptidase [Rhodospirillales bacterium CG15_BIG_FIL_POST_REV_8_21_14_020_66_15]